MKWWQELPTTGINLILTKYPLFKPTFDQNTKKVMNAIVYGIFVYNSLRPNTWYISVQNDCDGKDLRRKIISIYVLMTYCLANKKLAKLLQRTRYVKITYRWSILKKGFTGWNFTMQKPTSTAEKHVHLCWSIKPIE